MKREVIPFTTEEAWLKERTKWLTSSDIPCLFNVGYQTYEELFQNKLHQKQNKIEESEEMSWGKYLEDRIAQRFCDVNKWEFRHKSEFIIIPEYKIASSFDYEISIGNGVGFKAEALLEIKNVNEWKYKKDWIQGFEIQATPYIELQLQNELLVSGLEVGYIGALIGGCKGILLKRTANKKIQDAILLKAAEFWRKIDESNNP